MTSPISLDRLDNPPHATLHADGLLFRDSFINVLVEGASNSGADTSTTLNTILSNAPSGSTVLFPPGNYGLSTGLTYSNKSLNLWFMPGACLVELAVLSPVLEVIDGDGSVLTDVCVSGMETSTSFDLLAAATLTGFLNAGIRIHSSDDVNVVRPSITGKTVGIRVNSSDRVCVDVPTVRGFFTAMPAVADPQWHSGVVITSALDCVVRSPFIREIGSGVLSGTSSARTSVITPHIRTYFDNAIYMSSGNDGEVVGGDTSDGQGAQGSGVKVRGNNHRVKGVHIKDALSGIAGSGNGATTDAYDANGYGLIFEGNVIENTVQDGIIMAAQDGLHARHVLIKGNTLTNISTAGGGFGAFRGPANRMEVIDNTVVDCLSTAASISLTWTKSTHVNDPAQGTGLIIRGNRITNSLGHAIRANNWTDAEISDNWARQVAAGKAVVQALSVVNSRMNDNDGSGTTAVVTTDTNSSSNRLYDNLGPLVLGNQGTTAVNWVKASGTGAPTINARAGSIYHREDGGTTNSVYVKESNLGSSDWVPK